MRIYNFVKGNVKNNEEGCILRMSLNERERLQNAVKIGAVLDTLLLSARSYITASCTESAAFSLLL